MVVPNNDDLSAIANCGRKQLKMTVDKGEKLSLLNQNVNEAIRAKKMLCRKTGHRCICNPGYPRHKKLLLRQQKYRKNAVETSLIVIWILTICRQAKHFDRPF